jgi:hypothetical protein
VIESPKLRTVLKENVNANEDSTDIKVFAIKIILVERVGETTDEEIKMGIGDIGGAFENVADTRRELRFGLCGKALAVMPIEIVIAQIKYALSVKL